MNGRASSFIECAADYAEAGYYTDAVFMLENCPDPTPMVWYHLAYSASLNGDSAAAKRRRPAPKAFPLPAALR